MSAGDTPSRRATMAVWSTNLSAPNSNMNKPAMNEHALKLECSQPMMTDYDQKLTYVHIEIVVEKDARDDLPCGDNDRHGDLHDIQPEILG